MTDNDDQTPPVDAANASASRISEAERQAQARRERAARTLRENLMRRKQQGRARRAGDADDTVGLPAAMPRASSLGTDDASKSGEGQPGRTSDDPAHPGKPAPGAD